MKRINHGTLTGFAILVSLLLLPISYGNAASVREVSMDEMLQQCQFVFEGKVVALNAKKNSRNRIHTYVTFKIQEVIKGEYPSNTITLSFLGGTVGDVTMAVSDMKFPQVGEHGIYFVESLERSQVHPLYGWSQGHYIVERDATGTDRVMNSSKQPVVEVVSDTPVNQLNPNQKSVPAPSKRGAPGLAVAQEKKDARGLTVDEFKKVLHERMGEMQ
ncbi:MAG: hypothetical protein WC256_09435 [Desulfurivibrionaceae bacterium]